MSSLMEKMLAIGGKKIVQVMSDSDFYSKKHVINLNVPVLNMATSGSMTGGLMPGVSLLAGVSKSFKTMLGLYMMRQFLDQNPNGLAILYDSEFGITPEYLDSVGIDTSRVLDIKITDIEQLTIDMRQRLEAIDAKKDRVFILVDSLGNLASKKEAADALEGKGVQDMTRARTFKSFFRIVTPFIAMKNIYFVGIAHTYQTIEMYSKTVVSGGTGQTYSANQIFIITKSVEKEGDQISANKFTISINKSRYVKEQSKFPFLVSFKTGIYKYSAIWDWAIEARLIEVHPSGWFKTVDLESGEIMEPKKRRGDIETDTDYMRRLSESKQLVSYVENKYKLNSTLISEEIGVDGEDFAIDSEE